MVDELKRKIIIRQVFFGVFLALTIVFLVSAILGGIANSDAIINSIAIGFGIATTISLVITIVLGVNFTKLMKERKFSDKESLEEPFEKV